MKRFQIQRTIGNDYATDLINSRKYYGQALDAYAATESPDDDYLLHLSEIVGILRKLIFSNLAKRSLSIFLRVTLQFAFKFEAKSSQRYNK